MGSGSALEERVELWIGPARSSRMLCYRAYRLARTYLLHLYVVENKKKKKFADQLPVLFVLRQLYCHLEPGFSSVEKASIDLVDLSRGQSQLLQ